MERRPPGSEGTQGSIQGKRERVEGQRCEILGLAHFYCYDTWEVMVLFEVFLFPPKSQSCDNINNLKPFHCYIFFTSKTRHAIPTAEPYLCYCRQHEPSQPPGPLKPACAAAQLQQWGHAGYVDHAQTVPLDPSTRRVSVFV